MRKKIIRCLRRMRILTPLLWLFHRIIGQNRISISRGNHFDSTTANIYRNRITVHKCIGNIITIGADSDLHNSDIRIKGNGNRITIGENCFLNGLKIIIEGDNNSVYIGNHVFVLDDTKMYVVDGSSISVHDGCMFSDHIDIRTTDNHAIFDRKTKDRINKEKNVTIHAGVWLGTRVLVLKGVELAEGCIVGAGSVVTHSFDTPHIVVAGNPAKKLRENIVWTMPRANNWNDVFA